MTMIVRLRNCIFNFCSILKVYSKCFYRMKVIQFNINRSFDLFRATISLKSVEILKLLKRYFAYFYLSHRLILIMNMIFDENHYMI